MRYIAQTSTSTATKGMLRTLLQPKNDKAQKTVISSDKTLLEQPEPHTLEKRSHSEHDTQSTDASNIKQGTDKKQRDAGRHADQKEELTIFTWNVMGTTTVFNELDMLKQRHKPWITKLTETKPSEQPQDRKLLEPHLQQYKIYHSRVKGQVKQGLRSGHAGIAIAMHESLTTQKSITPMNLDHPVAKGHCKVSKLQPAGTDAPIMWGVNLPCTDMSKRQETYDLLQTEMQNMDKEACAAGTATLYHIVAGNMNAAFYDDDRQCNIPKANAGPMPASNRQTAS